MRQIQRGKGILPHPQEWVILIKNYKNVLLLPPPPPALPREDGAAPVALVSTKYAAEFIGKFGGGIP